MTSCPFRHWFHVYGKDNRYSFGISVDGGYNCFTCGQKGSLLELPNNLRQYNPNLPYGFTDFICNHLNFTENFNNINMVSKLDKSLVDGYSYANPVLALSQKDIIKWNIRQIDDMLLFPIYDRTNDLVAIKGRKVNCKSFLYLADTSSKKGGVWYGEHFLFKKWLALTEGERDAILLSRYMPVWACLGGLSQTQCKRVESLTCNILLAFDNDDAGQTYKNKIIKHLNSKVYDIIDYQGCKDVAEIIEQNKFNQIKIRRLL